ncbi:CatB-related O-acetyltransferase [Roseovarius sp. E0-M6]|uniref:CatB-related O-acetyltransferase n=1 Tax=Roseovarius sp. E0-M6 TaxID=3127118 RepID=UPI00300FE514
MNTIEEQFRYLIDCIDWMPPKDANLCRFHGTFETAQFLETPCRTGVDFDAFNFMMGRHSFYHCRTQMPNQTIIGRHCSINALALIGAVSHNVGDLTTGCLDVEAEALDELHDRQIFRSPLAITTIGCDVWVGANAVVLQGCHIGHGACVAAGAIVTQSVKPFSIVAGVPARHLRYRFDEPTRTRLLRSPWWQLPQDLLSTLPRKDVSAALTIAESHFVDKE